MAKKKTRKKNTTTTTPAELQSLVAQVANLFQAETDGDEAKLADLIRDRLGVQKAQWDRWLSGDELPADSKAELMTKLLEANKDTPAGAEPKRRTEPTEKERERLEDLELQADLTAHPAWQRLAKAINRMDAKLTESLRDCKPSELRGIQGQIEAFDWLRGRVVKQAEELADMPIFSQGYVIKTDRKNLTVTVSKR